MEGLASQIGQIEPNDGSGQRMEFIVLDLDVRAFGLGLVGCGCCGLHRVGSCGSASFGVFGDGGLPLSRRRQNGVWGRGRSDSIGLRRRRSLHEQGGTGANPSSFGDPGDVEGIGSEEIVVAMETV